MSESPKSRTLAEVQQEYANMCYKYGHLLAQSKAFAADAELVFEQLKELNFEAAKVQTETKKEESKS